MISDVLVNIVREKIKMGMGEGVIKSTLMSEGWSLTDIEEAVEKEMKGIDKDTKIETKTSLIKYLGFTVIGLVIALAGGYGILTLKTKYLDVNVESDVPLATQSASVSPTPPPMAISLEQESLLADKDFVDKKEGFKIRPPKDWDVDSSGKLGAPIYFFGPPAKADDNFVFRANINVMTGPANNNTVDGYANFYLGTLSNKLEKFGIREKRKLTISGRSAIIIRDFFEKDSNEYTGTTLIIIENDKVYVVSGVALKSGYEEVKQQMDLSIYSFNVL